MQPSSRLMYRVLGLRPSWFLEAGALGQRPPGCGCAAPGRGSTAGGKEPAGPAGLCPPAGVLCWVGFHRNEHPNFLLRRDEEPGQTKPSPHPAVL